MGIAIAGGGIGGLTLAQRLRDSEHKVTVLEARPRDAAAQGYRVSLKQAGIEALRSALPAAQFELVVATRIRQATRMIFMDAELRPKFQKPIPALEPTEALGVNRQTLREILAVGLDIRYDRPVASYAVEGGRVLVHAGAERYEAGLLVGADGSDSAVRRQLLPEARLDDLGWTIWGRTPLTPEVHDWLPAELDGTFNRVLHPDGAAMSVATCRAVEHPTVAAARLGIAGPFTEIPDYLSWTLTPREPNPNADEQRLRELALHTVDGWHPALRRIIEGAAPGDVFAVRIRSAHPVDPWTEEPVTLLGDAVHTMSPGRGDGANIALRDADTLGRLLAPARTTHALHTAARQYETAMLDYAFRAVAASREQPFAPFARPSTST